MEAVWNVIINSTELYESVDNQMIKPIFLKEGRCFVKVDKTPVMDGKKQALDEYGNEVYKDEQMCTVISSTVKELKKGDRICPIVRGGVPIYHLETKKHKFITLDVEDIYAQEV